MANRRMLSKSISYSKQVNSLSNEFTKLVFTWGIPHLDDFGKIDGDPWVFRSMVMPWSNKTEADFENAIQEIIKAGLVERYEVNGDLVLHYLGFEKHQTGLNKRTRSKYPNKDGSYEEVSENSPEIPRGSLPTEQNRDEVNKTEPISSEGEVEGKSEGKPSHLANNSYKRIGDILNPRSFVPKSEAEAIIKETWERLEPNNIVAFKSTYVKAFERGLPIPLFGQFASEIEQDPNIRNRGAVFNKKVEDYLANNSQT